MSRAFYNRNARAGYNNRGNVHNNRNKRKGSFVNNLRGRNQFKRQKFQKPPVQENVESVELKPTSIIFASGIPEVDVTHTFITSRFDNHPGLRCDPSLRIGKSKFFVRFELKDLKKGHPNMGRVTFDIRDRDLTDVKYYLDDDFPEIKKREKETIDLTEDKPEDEVPEATEDKVTTNPVETSAKSGMESVESDMLEPENMPVKELRSALAKRGLYTRGLKADLIRRLNEYIQTKKKDEPEAENAEEDKKDGDEEKADEDATMAEPEKEADATTSDVKMAEPEKAADADADANADAEKPAEGETKDATEDKPAEESETAKEPEKEAGEKEKESKEPEKESEKESKATEGDDKEDKEAGNEKETEAEPVEVVEPVAKKLTVVMVLGRSPRIKKRYDDMLERNLIDKTRILVLEFNVLVGGSKENSTDPKVVFDAATKGPMSAHFKDSVWPELESGPGSFKDEVTKLKQTSIEFKEQQEKAYTQDALFIENQELNKKNTVLTSELENAKSKIKELQSKINITINYLSTGEGLTSGEKPAEKSSEKSAEKSADKSDEKQTEKSAKKNEKAPAEKADGKPESED